jgi:hypothetical protein
MTPEEFKQKLQELDSEFEKRKRDLNKEYAFSNNPYKVGDIVTDHIGFLKIQTMKHTVSQYNLPQCVYFGIELKKDGTPMKKQTGRGVWQENIIKT